MLTRKQNELLTYLINEIEKNGVSPSYEEICKELHLKSKSGIHRIIKSLEERGFIERLENKARAIAPIKYPNGQTYNTNIINLKNKVSNQGHFYKNEKLVTYTRVTAVTTVTNFRVPGHF